MTGRHARLFGVRYGETRTAGPIAITGRREDHRALQMKVAFASFGPLQLEVIEPFPGPSIYQEPLHCYGESVHHIGYGITDVKGFLAAYRALGIEAMMYGQRATDPDIGFAYFDTRAELGILTEVVNGGSPRAGV